MYEVSRQQLDQEITFGGIKDAVGESIGSSEESFDELQYADGGVKAMVGFLFSSVLAVGSGWVSDVLAGGFTPLTPHHDNFICGS